MKLKIAIATGTRADWGLLSPLAKELQIRGNEINIIATNMHYAPEFGMTFTEICDDGFEISRAIRTEGSPAEIMAKCMTGFVEALESLKPDCLIILGDRFEMLSAASAATLTKVPIVHIAGGTVSQGAFDDAFRHAITKMSSLHLAETDECRNRIIQMGEQPDRVFATGAIGVQNALKIPAMAKEELEDFLKFKLSGKTLLVTLHAATLDALSPERQMNNLIEALDSVADYNIIFTYPNNDVASEAMINSIVEYRNSNPSRICAVPTLGRKRYLSVLRYVAGVVGNSSSGIVEVPSMRIPTLDIGIRQKGRIAADSVVHCSSETSDIIMGLKKITSPEFREHCLHTVNPYQKSDTIERMADIITSFSFKDSNIKTFFDLSFNLPTQ